MAGTDDWSGKTVLIVGGAGGMGRAAAAEFHALGANIAIADLRPTDFPSDHLAITGDVARIQDCARMVSETVSRFGRLDVLVNAAGVWVEGGSAEMTEAQWDRTLDINLKGTFFTCRYAIPELEKTEGQIINIASDAGLMGNAGAAIYCASKGGVVLLTKAMALELAPKGIRVNAICPCDVETPMLQYQAKAFGGGDPEGYLARLRAIYPQGARTRFAAPEEIAAFIVMVASPRLKPVTGAALQIDFATTAGK
ncbi:SDR family NAD(P)-dependent oxidoreductase [Aestuariivirga sp.]|uniref:SDR family NAD(P)-dependent oxidoreductase n=1 Tax=Aestuariivirga sp. TaxID=2650926 RepID=UPI0039E3AF7C